MPSWLAQVRHDLLKHALWCAADLRDCGRTGGRLERADLQALRRSLLELRDSEGQPCSAVQLWRQLRVASPAPPAALAEFESAVAAAEQAVRAACADVAEASAHTAALAAVLHLESAFTRLARSLDK